MVVAISRGLADRRLFEDEFVRDVQKRGAEAIASYPVLQDPTSADRKTIDEQAEGLGADAVLTSRVTGLEAKDEEFPWASYENIYINIETNLYAVKTHRLIWTATTKTWQRQDMSNEYGIRSVVRSITKKISQQGLLKPEPPETADKEGAKK
jgi:hypothetical protein